MRRNCTDYGGRVFGRWTVLSFHSTAKGGPLWVCRCECGTERPVSIGNLKSGKTTSCGCYQREDASKRFFRHGQGNHPLYTAWAGMKDRCYNPNDMDYGYYGARGIRVCEWWLVDFWHFWDDMASGWRPGLTVDRIDVNGNYEPDNCRWLSIKDQQHNRRPRGTAS